MPDDVAVKIVDETPGKGAMTNFITSCLQSGIAGSNFHDPIQKLKKPTFVQLVKKSNNSNNKTILFKSQRNLFGQIVQPAVNHNLNMQSALAYELGAIP